MNFLPKTFFLSVKGSFAPTARLLRKRAKALLFSLSVLSLIVVFPSSSVATSADWTNATVNSILALDSARKTVLRDLESIPTPSQDASDARDFVVYLNTRISAYCSELYKSGAMEAMEELPCPSAAMLGVEPGQTGQGSGVQAPDTDVQTDAPVTGTVVGTAPPVEKEPSTESSAELQGQFLDALGAFDEMLAQEEGKIASRIPSQREAGESGGSGSFGDSGRPGGEGDGQAGQSSSAAGQGMESGETADGSGSVESHGEMGKVPAGGGSGSQQERQAGIGVPEGKLPPPEDDDIVARQLREAAEKEQDPELKKKLWEEYWKYKGVVKK